MLLPSNLDETAFLHAASQRSIFIAPGSLFMPDRSPARAMRINIAYALDKRFLDLLREWVH